MPTRRSARQRWTNLGNQPQIMPLSATNKDGDDYDNEANDDDDDEEEADHHGGNLGGHNDDAMNTRPDAGKNVRKVTMKQP